MQAGGAQDGEKVKGDGDEVGKTTTSEAVGGGVDRQFGSAQKGHGPNYPDSGMYYLFVLQPEYKFHCYFFKKN